MTSAKPKVSSKRKAIDEALVRRMVQTEKNVAQANTYIKAYIADSKTALSAFARNASGIDTQDLYRDVEAVQALTHSVQNLLYGFKKLDPSDAFVNSLHTLLDALDYERDVYESALSHRMQDYAELAGPTSELGKALEKNNADRKERQERRKAAAAQNKGASNNAGLDLSRYRVRTPPTGLGTAQNLNRANNQASLSRPTDRRVSFATSISTRGQIATNTGTTRAPSRTGMRDSQPQPQAQLPTAAPKATVADPSQSTATTLDRQYLNLSRQIARRDGEFQEWQVEFWTEFAKEFAKGHGQAPGGQGGSGIGDLLEKFLKGWLAKKGFGSLMDMKNQWDNRRNPRTGPGAPAAPGKAQPPKKGFLGKVGDAAKTVGKTAVKALPGVAATAAAAGSVKDLYNTLKADTPDKTKPATADTPAKVSDKPATVPAGPDAHSSQPHTHATPDATKPSKMETAKKALGAVGGIAGSMNVLGVASEIYNDWGKTKEERLADIEAKIASANELNDGLEAMAPEWMQRTFGWGSYRNKATSATQGAPLEGKVEDLKSVQAQARSMVEGQTGVKAYAQGGVIGDKTVMIREDGSLAVMSEAGPEAILPLVRTPDGDLGVKSIGSGKGQTTATAGGAGMQVAPENLTLELDAPAAQEFAETLVKESRLQDLLEKGMKLAATGGGAKETIKKALEGLGMTLNPDGTISKVGGGVQSGGAGQRAGGGGAAAQASPQIANERAKEDEKISGEAKAAQEQHTAAQAKLGPAREAVNKADAEVGAAEKELRGINREMAQPGLTQERAAELTQKKQKAEGRLSSAREGVKQAGEAYSAAQGAANTAQSRVQAVEQQRASIAQRRGAEDARMSDGKAGPNFGRGADAGKAAEALQNAPAKATDYKSDLAPDTDYSQSKAGSDALVKGTYDAFRKAGMSHEGAKAMTAEIGRENSFKPDTMFGSHTDPYNQKRNSGFMSWQQERSDGLMKHLKEQGALNPDGSIQRNQKALDAMAGYAMKEMESGGPGQKANPSLAAATKTPGADYGMLNRRLGKEMIKWRYDDPNYARGHNNRDQFHRQAGRLTDQKEADARSGATAKAQGALDTKRAELSKEFNTANPERRAAIAKEIDQIDKSKTAEAKPAAPVDGNTKIKYASDKIKNDAATLSPETASATQRLTAGNGNVTVTSTTGGKHATGSQHYARNNEMGTGGRAVDVRIRDLNMEQRQKLVEDARKAGFTGIGLAKDHLHLDNRPVGKDGKPVIFDEGGGAEAFGGSVGEYRERLSKVQPDPNFGAAQFTKENKGDEHSTAAPERADAATTKMYNEKYANADGSIPRTLGGMRNNYFNKNGDAAKAEQSAARARDVEAVDKAGVKREGTDASTQEGWTSASSREGRQPQAEAKPASDNWQSPSSTSASTPAPIPNKDLRVADTVVPGMENAAGQTATQQAQPYGGVVMHVTGHQSMDKQTAFQKQTGYGYQYVVDKEGKVHQMVSDPDSMRTNHIRGAGDPTRTDRQDLTNRNALGIGMITGGKQPTEAQMKAMQQRLPEIYARHGIPTTTPDGKPNYPMGHGEIQGNDASRNTLGPNRTPEGQVMAEPFRKDWDSFSKSVESKRGTQATATAEKPADPSKFQGATPPNMAARTLGGFRKAAGVDNEPSPQQAAHSKASAYITASAVNKTSVPSKYQPDTRTAPNLRPDLTPKPTTLPSYARANPQNDYQRTTSPGGIKLPEAAVKKADEARAKIREENLGKNSVLAVKPGDDKPKSTANAEPAKEASSTSATRSNPMLQTLEQRGQDTGTAQTLEQRGQASAKPEAQPSAKVPATGKADNNVAGGERMAYKPPQAQQPQAPQQQASAEPAMTPTPGPSSGGGGGGAGGGGQVPQINPNDIPLFITDNGLFPIISGIV